jgi:hypothetical protein
MMTSPVLADAKEKPAAAVPVVAGVAVGRGRALRPRRLAKDLFGSVIYVLVFLFLLSQIVVLALLDIF